MKVLERAAGHALRSVLRSPTSTSRRSRPGPTTPCAARSAASAPTRRSSRWKACMDRLRRHGAASPVGRSGHRNVIDPGEVWGPGPDHGRRVCRGAAAASTRCKPAYDAAVAAGRARRRRPRASRTPGSATASRRSRGRWCVSQRTAPSRCATAGPRWARACTPSPARSRSRSSASTRHGCGSSSTRRASWAPGQTTGSPGHAHGRGLGAGRVRGRPCGRLPAWASTTKASTASTGPTRSPTGSRARSSTPPSGTRPSSSRSTRDTGQPPRVVAAHDVGRAVNPTLCEGQIEGAVHMGLGYALYRGLSLPTPTGRPTNMTLRSLGHHQGQGHAAGRRDPRRGAAAPRAVRDQRRR